MFTDYTLTLTVDRLVGGLPRHPELVRRWQEAKWPARPSVLDPLVDPLTPEQAAVRTIEDLGDQVLSEDVDAIWTGFAERDGHLVLESRQVKAMLKESANIVRTLVKIGGKVIPLRSKVAERVFVHPKWIDLGVAQPTGTVERPIHVMTARGPRTALKRTDYIDDVKLSCTLRVLDDGLITTRILSAILDHAAENGLGTDRSQGNGTFTWELSD